ncbi:hypothetical protein [Paenibacillus sp. IHBB 10380]|uniref:hypothetical protein n=1 Tax=Paenibacillus sp. IHBB 10380 TaxID=1566358 RepID=UPI0005CFD440|nr:hypothetical protein [Paenibacillus sp. IHBB 10380]AJS60484.1 membrane protein [Paenibacillus sp. IHBB 10380]
MRDFTTLKILDRFRTLFEKLGIDYVIMRRIIHIKLTMDGRRVSTVMGNSRSSSQNEDKNKFLQSLWLYLIMGLIVLMPLVLLGQGFIFQMSLVFGILMFMIMTSLISDFSSVLLDIRDKNILDSKPVNTRTIHAAKSIHISIYLTFLTGALTLPALIAGSFKYGIGFFFIFLIEVILMDAFIVVVTALLYLFVLRFFNGEKLKDMINYVQIALTMVITIGYQLTFRVFNIMDFKWVFEEKWWQYFIVPLWFATPFEMLIRGDMRTTFMIFSLLSVIVPIVAMLIYVRLMPSFEHHLQKLSDSSTSRRRKWFNGRSLSNFLCKTPEERLFFRFTSDMMRNERDFKLKVYPSLGLSLVFPFLFLFNSMQSQGLEGMSGGKMYLCIYFMAILVPSTLMMLKYSVNYKGAWLYRTVPLQDTASILKGSIKACLVKLMMPLYILESVVFLYIFGLRIIPDIVVVGLSVGIYVLISFRVLRKALPFSEPYQATQSNEGLKLFFLIGVLVAFIGVHLLFTTMSYGVYIYMILLIGVNIVGWRKSFRTIPISSF